MTTSADALPADKSYLLKIATFVLLFVCTLSFGIWIGRQNGPKRPCDTDAQIEDAKNRIMQMYEIQMNIVHLLVEQNELLKRGKHPCPDSENPACDHPPVVYSCPTAQWDPLKCERLTSK